jgi:hypothetical protein
LHTIAQQCNSSPTRRLHERLEKEEEIMGASVKRTLVILAAVALAASSAVGAERTMLNEQFTATW